MATAIDSTPGADPADDIDLDFGGDDEADAGAKGNEGDKSKDEKPKETLEQRETRLERQLAQTRKKLGKGDDKGDEGDKSKDEKPKDAKPDAAKDLDYGQKAFLTASGIKGQAEVDLVKDWLKDRPDRSLEDILENKRFLGELKELREDAEADDATPKGDKARGSSSSKSSVEYWIAKGGLPENTPENQKLRTDIVNARSKKASSGSQFTDTPVVS